MAAKAVYYHPRFLDHDTGNHPESAPRLVAARKALASSGLDFEWRSPSNASLEALERVHDSGYIRSVRELAQDGGGRLDLDTAVSPLSYEAALLAAGAGVEAVTASVRDGDRCFCLVRPPGHHARRSKGMGFCLFNNIAVAAAHARAELGVERVLIVDWDVHHGNGTQETFYDDPSVLFCSMHQQWHYPGTGWPDEIGAGGGEGYTANLSLPAGAGNGAARLFIEELVEPLARRHRPDLVLVSAGYDSQAGDRLGGFRMQREAFGWMTSRLVSLVSSLDAAGPTLFLEGGYVPDMMADSIVATVAALDGTGDVELEGREDEEEREALSAVVRALSPYWPDTFSIT